MRFTMDKEYVNDAHSGTEHLHGNDWLSILRERLRASFNRNFGRFDRAGDMMYHCQKPPARAKAFCTHEWSSTANSYAPFLCIYWHCFSILTQMQTWNCYGCCGYLMHCLIWLLWVILVPHASDAQHHSYSHALKSFQVPGCIPTLGSLGLTVTDTVLGLLVSMGSLK